MSKQVLVTRAQAITIIDAIAAKAHMDRNCGGYVVEKELNVARMLAKKLSIELETGQSVRRLP